MVRFIIEKREQIYKQYKEFTFQYGQIYYVDSSTALMTESTIYIPIWLDLLLIFCIFDFLNFVYLHSNMVRFIIWKC